MIDETDDMNGTAVGIDLGQSAFAEAFIIESVITEIQDRFDPDDDDLTLHLGA